MTKTAVFVSTLVFVLALAGLVQDAACGTRGAAEKVADQVADRKSAEASGGERLASGTWGGDHVRMEVSDAGATIEFDCAHGAIEQAIVLDPDAKFDLKATYTVEHGGPMRDDQPLPVRPARYAGRVAADTLTLTVTLTDTDEDAGTYTLTRGSGGRVMKCR